MFDFFSKRGRGSQGAPESKAASPASNPAASASSRTSQQHTATHRELVRVVLRDTLRMDGIPESWIGCETLNMSRSSGDVVLMIQLTILKWHDELPRYATVLQQQLIQGLQRFDPASDHSKHVVVWKFSPHCGCPHSSMPDPGFWTAPPVKPKFDLPQSRNDQLDNEFTPTVPGQLR